MVLQFKIVIAGFIHMQIFDGFLFTSSNPHVIKEKEIKTNTVENLNLHAIDLENVNDAVWHNDKAVYQEKRYLAVTNWNKITTNQFGALCNKAHIKTAVQNGRGSLQVIDI